MHTHPRLQKIDQLACELHAGQTRKGSDLPYITHPRAVMNIAVTGERVKFYHPEVVEHVAAVALLHDVLEDTPIRQTELFAKVIKCDWTPQEALSIVRDVGRLTRHKNQSILEYLNVIKESFPATLVKRADLEHNLSDLKPGNLMDKYHLCQEFLK
jgi:(p)ppGpp synthase/HD superfamily hydrolase